MSESASPGPRHPLVRFLSLNAKTNFLRRFLLAELNANRLKGKDGKPKRILASRKSDREEAFKRV